ncbi:HAD family hydrolase [uncultured Thioclava sp.]|uniref:HAD family hydrolase n=1 Tax=uncultured Thioclava sp. TaxID=473858 RepID=UPI0025CDE956|nr:HAD family hydrolase [uncultured Thioclava sp.]
MFDLCIFDCDGVLIDSEIISANMLIAELRNLDVNIDLDYVARNFLGRSYPTVMKQIRFEFGLDLPEDFEARYRARLLAAFESDLRVMPGVSDVIAQLGVSWCVATSSSPQRAQRSLEIVGLDKQVQGRIFTASEVAQGKPAPDLFLHAARQMGADPARCVVIEDSLTGIRAGLAAGMTVWRFTGGSHLHGRPLMRPADAIAQLEFASFDEFFHLGPNMRAAT